MHFLLTPPPPSALPPFSSIEENTCLLPYSSVCSFFLIALTVIAWRAITLGGLQEHGVSFATASHLFNAAGKGKEFAFDSVLKVLFP